jgi:rhomboid protease GluP
MREDMGTGRQADKNAAMDAAQVATDGGLVGYRIPLARPRWTFILLGVNIAVFLAMTVFGALNGLGLGGSQDFRVLLIFGAMQNQLIAQGEYHRLLTSMFLHIGLIHLLFNSYALYVVGQDVERLYGSARFLVIYFLSGLGGSLASFVLGAGGISAGASGAIFGLIGASIAYFYLHRATFGPRGQAQLRSLLFLAGINLVLGFTIPGINNLAHMGGLVFGALLGWILAPKYQAPLVFVPAANGALTLEDSTTIGRRLPMLLAVTVILAVLVLVGTMRWGG